MRIKEIPIPNSRLTEGSYHIFKILKTQNFGADDSWFIMQDPLGYKVLMPLHFYTRYGFEAGQDVMCRVDRINCNGRMFLEPMHPHYKEGECYDFDVLGKGTKTGITGETEHFVKVIDVLGYEWKVPVYSDKIIEESSAKIACKLERIKKGKLFLSIDSDKALAGGLINGEIYTFCITDEKINPDDGMKYFILEDQQGGKQLLKKKYYLHYGLKKGQQINCRVDKFTMEGFYFLEPENPWYTIGEVYDFKILEINKLIFSDGSEQHVLVLDDKHSEPVKVFISPGQLKNVLAKETIRCMVKGFRKSRAELEIILDAIL